MADADREANIARGCFQTIIIGVVILVAIVALSGTPGSDGGNSGSRDSVTWEEYDVTIEVGADGVLHVTEQQEVRFNGDFSQGYAEIPMERIGSIDNVRISVEGRPADRDGDGRLSSEEARRDGEMVVSEQVTSATRLEPNTFHTIETDDTYRIDYAFESTSSGTYSFRTVPQVRTVVLEYDVIGAIRDYPEADEPWQQVHWMAIATEVTDIANIEASTVTIILPEEVPVDDLAWAPEPDNVEGNRLTWSRTSMREGDSFDVQAAFPTITAATAPDWQPAADARDERLQDEENRQSLASVLLIGAGILTLVGGGIGILYAWYSRVREAVPGVVPDELPEPPDDLPAALVGALVDEEVHPRDIAAAILDLDQRGIVKITTADGSEVERPRFGRRGHYNIELVEPISNALPYEQTILRSIFRRGAEPGKVESFDALRALFGSYRENIQHAMDEELVQRGYLAEMPEKSRQRWTRILKGFVGLTAVVAIGILVWAPGWTWWALVPPTLGVGIYYLGKRLTPSIAMKTPEGAEVSARWQAFENFLRSHKHGLMSSEWERIHGQYMPWVVAFGMDHHWLGSMNTPYGAPRRATTPTPGTTTTWSQGSTRPRTHTWGSGPGRSRGSSGSGWAMSTPNWDASRWSDMQGASDSVLSKLGSGSSSMFDMLGDAMEAMGEHSRNSGGGGSSGGFGGSSRSGGGRSSSSSGGGSRGFS